MKKKNLSIKSSYWIQKFLIDYMLWFQLILLCLIIIFIILLSIGAIKMETDKLIGIFLGLLSLIYTVNNSYHQNKKIFKDLFDKFNDRYNDLNDKLNDLIKRISDEEFSEKLSYTDDKTMNDYLNLCSEEYYWYKRGMIDSEVWINWLTGIKYFLKHPIFITKIKSEVSYEINNGDSYYGFLNYYERNKNEK